MTQGTLYGIGVGPGDSEWITVKAARILGQCRDVFVPRSRIAADSLALQIARPYLRPDAAVVELTFPMTANAAELERHWLAAAKQVAAVLDDGRDACFLTLGDSLLYSTYVYLLRSLRTIVPHARVETVPGVTAFSAAAALTGFAVGQGKEPVTIVPADDDLADLSAALDRGGTVVLMKVGRRLDAVLDILESRNLLDQAVFVSRAGLPDQRIETDVRRLRRLGPEAGYLSIMLIHAGSGI